MSFAIRGVIEGFYGRLWTPDERLRVVEAVAEAGFTTYAYAPKEDRLQNADWRTPYPDERVAELRTLGRTCERSGVALWLGLRPVGISYADDDDLALVLDKVRVYLDLGAERIVLLADDIPSELDRRAGGRFATLADAHAWLVDRLLTDAPLDPGRLVFVPTDYHGFGSPYLERIGEALPPTLDVCWTGRDVFASTITVAEVQRVASVLRRPPLVWDNYPVNDEHDHHDLRIGPIRGREAGLADVTRGFLVNPAQEPEATLVPLLTWGEYLADPDGYDADAAWRRALRRVAGSEQDAATVATIAAALDRSILGQGWRAPSASDRRAAAGRLAQLGNRALGADLTRFVDAG